MDTALPVTDAPSSRKLTRRAYTWLVPGYFVMLAIIVRGAMDRPPYDDSYFFKRFALSFLDHGVFAWNVADGPVYGNTSQLYQLVVTAVTAFTRTHTLFSVRVLLALFLLVGFVLALRTSLRRGAVVAPTLGFCTPIVSLSVLSGMETALAFALLALFCAVIDPDSNTPRPWFIAPLVCFCVWLARPDAVLLAAPILFGLTWLKHRRVPLREVALLLSLIGGCLVLFRLYYGTALPLPFYAKQRAFSPYDEHFIALSDHWELTHFSVFMWAALPLCLLALARPDRVNVILLGAFLLFEVYHLTFTIDVMGMRGRFFAPALPVLVFAAARGERVAWSWRRACLSGGVYVITVAVLAAADRLPIGPIIDLEKLNPAYYALGTAAGLAALSMSLGRASIWVATGVIGMAIVSGVVSFPSQGQRPLNDEEFLFLHESHVTVYRGLEIARACFGDGIRVYHSEVGVVGLRFEHGTVTDLAGLLSRQWLFREQHFDQACSTEQPEIIFLPHRNYVRLNEEIRGGSCIRGYVLVQAESSSPLYVRRDLAPRYLSCAAGPS